MRKVLELQYLAGDLVDFLELSTFINAKWMGDLDMCHV